MQDILDKISHAVSDVQNFVPKDAQDLEAFRIRILGSKGLLKDLFALFKDIPNEEKKAFGARLNDLKVLAESKLEEYKAKLEEGTETKGPGFDLSMPGMHLEMGSRHPVNIVKQQMIEIFARIGFTVAEGPEIEDDWHNFSALNTPKDHPARDMQDTFYLDSEYLLRTHTSPVQIRVMENKKPPIRIITPGRVYRNETISARAHCTFHQVEGLYIDEDVSFADLKQTLYYFAREMFGEGAQIRLRPSYFPFTEPSAELDVFCFICNQKGCAVCKGTGWLEIGGCGMVDPAVLENCKIDTEKYTGFAFGMGIERITMLKFGINDIRLFYENDVRFLKQFSTSL